MAKALGITQDGLKTALKIKDDYRNKRPILMPGEDDRLVVPETMLNHNINLTSLEDPLALAMMAARDPEAPMALAAAARLCPMGSKTQLLGGVVEIIGETWKHEANAWIMSMIGISSPRRLSKFAAMHRNLSSARASNTQRRCAKT